VSLLWFQSVVQSGIGAQRHRLAVQSGEGADLIANRLLAAFELTRTGVLTRDLANPLFRIQTGEQQSGGVEFDVNGSPAPGWSINGSMTYLDANVTNDNTLPVGDGLQDAPPWSASLWGSHEWRTGAFQGFGLGAGVFYVGAREATLPNTFLLNAYTRVDASVFWRRDRLRVQMDLRNVFDEKYATGGAAGTFGYTVMPGWPRSVQLSGSVGF
jgi:iron complex outermembrane receptor protein